MFRAYWFCSKQLRSDDPGLLLCNPFFGDMPLYSDINQDGDIKRGRARSEAYRSYLRSIAEYLPEATKGFVLSDWYYADFDKCPHDAWVDSLEIVERASGERKQIREIHIKLKLLAASHRGHNCYTYENVSQYDLNARWLYCRTGPKHEDWLNDEITLAGTGEVEHEIVFRAGTQWNIRCKSISYEYRPIAESAPDKAV